MEKIMVYTYRYMWQLKNSKGVNFKIVTDTIEGLSLFEKNLLALSGIVRASKEYISEIDVSKMGLFENLLNKSEVEENEKV